MDINMYFAGQLKAARKSMKLTQKQLADKISYSGKSISKWESGYGLPTVETLVELSKILNVSVDFLIVPPIKTKYFLGIDGGGTKTKFMLVDENGNLIIDTVKPASNPSNIGFDGALDVLRSGIEEVCKDFPYNQISMFAGLAGFTGQNKENFYSFFKKYPFNRVGVSQDIDTLTFAGLGKKQGIVAIMGTGIVVRCQTENGCRTIGGWGTFFDKGGSGYTVGRDAIAAALRDIDKSGPKTILTEMVAEKLGAPADLAISEIYRKGATYIASFSSTAVKAAKLGDKIASDILEKNMCEAAKMIDAAAKEIHGNNIPVVFSGGMCNEYETLFPIIKKHLKDNRSFNFSVLDKDPIYGALLLAGLNITEE